jgi:hypothetical protein
MEKIDKILEIPITKKTIASIFYKNKIEVLKRPACYIIKLKDEPKDKVKRVILLKPKGFTSNEFNEMSPHPEVRMARVIIKGAIRKGNEGFILLKNILKYCYYKKREIDVKENYPYAEVNKNNPFYGEETKSAREKFFVVKENGFGFYHNLINLSNEWILLILEKELRLQKEINFNPIFNNLQREKQEILLRLFNKIKEFGDEIFNKEQILLKQFMNLDVDEAVPFLIEGLNVYESGNHEPCTFYAFILKFAKKEPKRVLNLLIKALSKEDAPAYYLQELINKIKNI